VWFTSTVIVVLCRRCSINGSSTWYITVIHSFPSVVRSNDAGNHCTWSSWFREAARVTVRQTRRDIHYKQIRQRYIHTTTAPVGHSVGAYTQQRSVWRRITSRDGWCRWQNDEDRAVTTDRNKISVKSVAYTRDARAALVPCGHRRFVSHCVPANAAGCQTVKVYNIIAVHASLFSAFSNPVVRVLRFPVSRFQSPRWCSAAIGMLLRT